MARRPQPGYDKYENTGYPTQEYEQGLDNCTGHHVERHDTVGTNDAPVKIPTAMEVMRKSGIVIKSTDIGTIAMTDSALKARTESSNSKPRRTTRITIL